MESRRWNLHVDRRTYSAANGSELGGTIYAWNSAATVSSIVIGAVLLIALFVYEAYADLPYPAIPVQFFANRGFISLVACATVATVSSNEHILLLGGTS